MPKKQTPTKKAAKKSAPAKTEVTPRPSPAASDRKFTFTGHALSDDQKAAVSKSILSEIADKEPLKTYEGRIEVDRVRIQYSYVIQTGRFIDVKVHQLG